MFMKIGFDAKRAFYNYSGLGNYSRNVISCLQHNFNEHEYYLYTPSLKKAISFIESENVNIFTPDTKSGRILKSYWRSFLLSKQLIRDGIQIFHGLSNELPAKINDSSIKSVVTIHDLIFIRYPELYNSIDREIYNRKFRYSSEIADIVIAVSQQTKNDLIEYYKTNEKKIKVIYQGCNDRYNINLLKKDIDEVKTKYDLPMDYILYVGTIEERKNLLNVVKALHLGKIDIPLVIIGKTTEYLKEVVNYICKNLVENTIFLRAVPFEDLPAIYQGAQIFIYPSIFEGFGIPILEALQSGVPVITSKGGCFEEVGGKAAHYVDPMSVDEIIHAIKKIGEDSELRKEMIEKGKSQAKKFSNSLIAQQIMNTYLEVL